jgi:membrane-associated phospholipid phosphatase
MSSPDPAVNRVKAWLIALVVTTALVAVAYAWLDRPIAFFAHSELTHNKLFAQLPKISEWFALIAIFVFAVLGLRGLTGRPLSKFEAVILLGAISLVASAAIKNQLKLVFGRTWPETWINNNPSLIRDNVYGFNFFHEGRGYEAFPSGHTTAVCAAMSVLWICYPRYRPLYALVVAAVVVGLIGADFHFLSDIVAGAFIGASTGWIAVLLWQAGGPRRISDDGGRMAEGGDRKSEAG